MPDFIGFTTFIYVGASSNRVQRQRETEVECNYIPCARNRLVTYRVRLNVGFVRERESAIVEGYELLSTRRINILESWC